MNKNTIKVIALFIISYLAIVIISDLNSKAENKLPISHIDFTGFPKKTDYSLILLPIVGYFFVYMLIPYLKHDFGFGEKFKKYAFPILFIIFSILAFWLAISAYYWDISLRAGLGFDLSRFNLNYWDLYLSSSFFYFTIAGLFGWASRLLIEKFEK